MKKHLILAIVVLAGATVVIAGCTSSSNPSPGQVTSTASTSTASTSTASTSTASQNPIAIQNYAFSPSALTIQKGASVTWTNYDSVQHMVVSDSPAFSSSLLNTGDTYTFQFNSIGTYPYHCSIHTYMKGTITVV
jgi:plastocyanin